MPSYKSQMLPSGDEASLFDLCCIGPNGSAIDTQVVPSSRSQS